MASAIGLRHPASASCLGRHLRLAGRCPNNSSLFPPLAAVVVVALWIFLAELDFLFEHLKSLRAFQNPFFTGREPLSGAPAPDSPLLSPTVTSSPGAGEVFPQRESQAVKFIAKVLGSMSEFPAVLLPLPLGEVDLRSKDGEGARR